MDTNKLSAVEPQPKKETADFADFHRLKKTNARVAREAKDAKVAYCFSRYNLLSNKELRRYYKKMTHKKQGNTRLYYKWT